MNCIGTSTKIHNHQMQPQHLRHLYLEACNLLFEQGLLSHDRIRSMDSDVLKNIDKGYSYFTAWLDSLFELGMHTHNLYKNVNVPFLTDPKFPHKSATQKSFLSWQSMYTYLFSTLSFILFYSLGSLANRRVQLQSNL